MVLVVTLLLIVSLWLIPVKTYQWIFIPLKMIIFGTLYAFAIIRFNISDDLTDLYRQIIIRIKGIKS
jgi:hypothetical protein